MKYKRVPQEPYCCVPACIQMIFLRHGLILYTQEKIGYELGLVVPERDVIYFNKVRISLKPEAGYGTQLNKEEFSLNNFFKKYNIPLEYEYHYIDDFDKAKQFLINNKENDIITCFHAGTLFDKPRRDYGHVALIDNINEDEITMFEVEGDYDEYYTTSLQKLVEAINVHGKNNAAGFWLIKKV